MSAFSNMCRPPRLGATTELVLCLQQPACCGGGSHGVAGPLPGGGCFQLGKRRGRRAAQARLYGWPLGATAGLQFAAPAVFDPASQRFYAATAAAGPAGAAAAPPVPPPAAQLLCWPRDLPPGPLDRGAERTALPRAVHSLHCVSDSAPAPRTAPEPPDAPGAAAADGGMAAEHGGPGVSTPGVFIVYSDGSVAVDTMYANGRTGSSEGAGPSGRRAAAAAAAGGRLAVVCSEPDGGASVTFYTAQARHRSMLRREFGRLGRWVWRTASACPVARSGGLSQHLLQALPRTCASCAARCQYQAGRGQGPGAVRRALPRVTRGCCCAGRRAAAVGRRRAGGAGGWRCGGRRQPRCRHPGAAVERRHAAVPARGAGRGAAGLAADPGACGARVLHHKRCVAQVAEEGVIGSGLATAMSA